MSDTLKLYVEHIEKLMQARSSALSEADMQDIVRELGLSDDDLRAIENEVQTRYERGVGFVDHKIWSDAIREFKEAAALAPTRTYVLHALANAYFGRAMQTKSTADFDHAEDYARRCLDIDPQYQSAYMLLSEINQNREYEESGLSTRKALIVFALSMGLCIVGGGVATIIALIIKPELADPPPAETVDKPVTIDSPSMPAVPLAPSKPVGGKSEAVSGSVITPVRLIAGEWDGKITLDMHASENKNYTDKSFYEWSGLVVNQSDQELDVVKAKFELRNAKGEVRKSDIIELVKDYQPELRPYDVYAFYTTVSSYPDVTEAVVTITTVDAAPAAKSYPESKLVPLKWDIKRPEHLNVEVRERESRFSKNSFNDKGYFSAAWEVTNTGGKNLELVKVGLRLFDAQNTLLDESSWLVTFSSAPPIKQGRARLAHTSKSVAQTYDHYELSIVDIR